jgi:hypothetical protein
MLPSETSLTYANDLTQHYRDVNRRIRDAALKLEPRAARAVPAERLGVAPEPEPEAPDVVAQALAELGDALAATILTPSPCTRIINETCLEHGIPREDLISPSRTQRLARIRQLAMWRCRQAGVSFPEIGRHFGRDHSTVLHAVRKIEAERGGV